MFNFISSLQHSHDGLRITGSIAASIVLVSSLAITLLPRPLRRTVIIPAVTLAISAIILAWALVCFEAA